MIFQNQNRSWILVMFLSIWEVGYSEQCWSSSKNYPFWSGKISCKLANQFSCKLQSSITSVLIFQSWKQNFSCTVVNFSAITNVKQASNLTVNFITWQQDFTQECQLIDWLKRVLQKLTWWQKHILQGLFYQRDSDLFWLSLCYIVSR